ncbi:Uncharacterised protein [Mycolicibacterium fortuitum]|uniref:Uncharacterized protein n=1 Tax=Mycolicibacterium fortuitum TaxID=1766 RepID=A0A378WFR3_MYCFO|nr:Uncharacterised protein [Mycolicibacterium fortuitum]
MNVSTIPDGHTTIAWTTVRLLCQTILDHGPAPLPAEVANALSELVHQNGCPEPDPGLHLLKERVLPPGIGSLLNVIGAAMRVTTLVAERTPTPGCAQCLTELGDLARFVLAAGACTGRASAELQSTVLSGVQTALRQLMQEVQCPS